jgi:excinuclease UvrABC nuclease subunit
VYFLLDEKKRVVYVGQSINVFQRVHDHLWDSHKKFRYACYMPAKREELDAIERHFIDALLPEYNKESRTKMLKRMRTDTSGAGSATTSSVPMNPSC